MKNISLNIKLLCLLFSSRLCSTSSFFVTKFSLGSAYDVDVVEKQISDYYAADKIPAIKLFKRMILESKKG